MEIEDQETNDLMGRRYKILHIDPNTIRDVLNWVHFRRKDGVLRLPVVRGMPDGSYIDGIWFSAERGTLMLKIFHESFPIVPLGCIAEELNSFHGIGVSLPKIVDEAGRSMYIITDEVDEAIQREMAETLEPATS